MTITHGTSSTIAILYFSYFRSVWIGCFSMMNTSTSHQLIQQTAHTWGQMAVKSTKTLRHWKMIHIFAKWSFIRKSHWYMTTISVQITHTHCRGAKTQSQMLMWNECLFKKKAIPLFIHSFFKTLFWFFNIFSPYLLPRKLFRLSIIWPTKKHNVGSY